MIAVIIIIFTSRSVPRMRHNARCRCHTRHARLFHFRSVPSAPLSPWLVAQEDDAGGSPFITSTCLTARSVRPIFLSRSDRPCVPFSDRFVFPSDLNERNIPSFPDFLVKAYLRHSVLTRSGFYPNFPTRSFRRQISLKSMPNLLGRLYPIVFIKSFLRFLTRICLHPIYRTIIVLGPTFLTRSCLRPLYLIRAFLRSIFLTRASFSHIFLSRSAICPIFLTKSSTRFHLSDHIIFPSQSRQIFLTKSTHSPISPWPDHVLSSWPDQVLSSWPDHCTTTWPDRISVPCSCLNERSVRFSWPDRIYIIHIPTLNTTI